MSNKVSFGTAALLLCLGCGSSTVNNVASKQVDAGQAETGGSGTFGGSTSTDSGGTQTGGSSAIEGGNPASGGLSSAGGASTTTNACCRQYGAASKVGDFASLNASELSGIVASRAHPGVLYAHQDSGSAAVFYAMNASGLSLGTFTLKRANATDWEDISVGPGPGTGTYLYLADIGDNAARTGTGTERTEIGVFRLPEPMVTASVAVGSQSIANWEYLRFKYPDKAHDAETLMVDPITGYLLIVTKETNGDSKVFYAPGNTAPDTLTVLELQATLAIGTPGLDSALVTAGDISPSGDTVILRSYASIWLWCRQSTWTSTFSAPPTEIPSATEPNGEGLTFSSDGTSWYSAGEQSTAIFQGLATCS